MFKLLALALALAACDPSALDTCGQREPLAPSDADVRCVYHVPAGRPCAPLTLFVDGIPQARADYDLACDAGVIVVRGALCSSLTPSSVVEASYD